MTYPHDHGAAGDIPLQFVTVRVAGQLFGMPIEAVQDVFAVEQLTPVPLAASDIAGVLNLRGRIVTAIDMRRRLGLPPAELSQRLAVGVDVGGESYGLLVDAVGEVKTVSANQLAANPGNMDACWSSIADGVVQFDQELMIVWNIEAILDLNRPEAAA